MKPEAPVVESGTATSGGSGGLRDRLNEIERRMREACRRSGREVGEVTLVGVSKTFPASVIREGIEAGLRVLGENRVQEAAAKMPELAATCATHGVTWHLIGHLQSNKVRRAVELFTMIHSVDSLRLAGRIDAVCGEIGSGRRMPVLVEVNLGGEATKAGISPTEAPAICEMMAKLPHIELCGLMTVPPAVADPGGARPFFARLRQMRDEILRHGFVSPSFIHLSMGMSHDFEVAIEEGATLIRVGTSIFGRRDDLTPVPSL